MRAESDKPLDIIGLGMSMIDLLQVVDEFPGEEGITEVEETRLMGGGPVPTAIFAAATLGARTAMIDRIGADWRGEQVAREFREAGVDLTHFALEPDRTTTFGSVLVRKRDGARHVVFSPGNFSPLQSDELPLGAIQSAKILHLNGRHWPACLDAADAMRETEGLVSFDGGANRFEKRFLELLPKVDVLIVAQDFAEKLSESTDRDAQLESLRSYGASIAGITEGADGSWFSTEEENTFHQPAFPAQEVIDTTGCGDVFHGAFLYGLTNGKPVRDCARLASAAAALNATALGGRGKISPLAEVEQFLETENSGNAG
ncbi:MAG: carbohydrate kinase [Verrucomicrobiales bacterium]|nr:carbohydrate kinase [Verrucomicrobiales bacterium]